MRGAPLDETRLRADFPQRFSEADHVRGDPERRALAAQRERRFDNIILDARPAGRVDPAQAVQALTDAVRDLGLDVLPWNESLQQWRARVSSLRHWLPEHAVEGHVAELPDLSDAALLASLDQWLQIGRASVRERVCQSV